MHRLRSLFFFFSPLPLCSVWKWERFFIIHPQSMSGTMEEVQEQLNHHLWWVCSSLKGLCSWLKPQASASSGKFREPLLLNIGQNYWLCHSGLSIRFKDKVYLNADPPECLLWRHPLIEWWELGFSQPNPGGFYSMKDLMAAPQPRNRRPRWVDRTLILPWGVERCPSWNIMFDQVKYVIKAGASTHLRVVKTYFCHQLTYVFIFFKSLASSSLKIASSLLGTSASEKKLSSLRWFIINSEIIMSTFIQKGMCHLSHLTLSKMKDEVLIIPNQWMTACRQGNLPLLRWNLFNSLHNCTQSP